MANEAWNKWRMGREDTEGSIPENVYLAHLNPSLNDLNLNFLNISLTLFQLCLNF